MNILQICYCFPPSFSGYGKQLSTVNKAFVNQKNNASILLLTAYKSSVSGSNYKCQSLFPYTRPENKVLEKLSYYIFCAFLPFLILLNKKNINLLHIVKAGPEAAIGVILGGVIKIPTIIKIAQDEIDYELEKISLLRRIRIKIISKANFFIALSDKISQDLKKIGVCESKIVKIPNSVEASKFNIRIDKNKLRSELFSGDSSEIIYTFVGAICKRKGVEDLLNALAVLDFDYPTHFYLIGPNYNDIGSFKEKINILQNRKNIAVSVIGKVEDAIPFICSSDFFILPSYSEGMPNVVLEALSCGVPVLASDIPVCREILNDKNGVIFEKGNVESLAEALSAINSLDWDSELISKSALKKYSSDVIANMYYELYQRAVDGSESE